MIAFVAFGILVFSIAFIWMIAHVETEKQYISLAIILILCALSVVSALI
ncbi:MAG: hypothetical protein LUE86_10220 [Clostridiales bacterium]|nr:hypothetical protein [Clostridiales bacterium]